MSELGVCAAESAGVKTLLMFVIWLQGALKLGLFLST